MYSKGIKEPAPYKKLRMQDGSGAAKPNKNQLLQQYSSDDSDNDD